MFTNDDFKNGKINRSTKYFKKTIIEDDVLIGSNSTILPVYICRGSVIGAGSVITKNVSNNSLSLTRSPQLEIKNYKRKK